MRTFVLAGAIALGVSGFVVPAAGASADDVVHGGCFFDSGTDLVTGPHEVGVIGDVSVTTTGDIPPAPIGATVTCWLLADGAVVPGSTHTYGDIPGHPGMQAGSDPASVTTTGPDDRPVVCESVTFADGTSTPADLDCPGFAGPEFPPQVVWDTFNEVGSCSDFVTSCFDLVACPVFVQLAGDYPGGVSIRPDGDVYLPDPLGFGLDPVYDCPPDEQPR